MRFFRNKDDELQREVEHHLHELAAAYERQGHSRQEARQLAKRDFGGTEQVKESCRDERWWSWTLGLRQDLQFGLRMMRRTPVITAAAILSLALGIGVSAGIASLMDVVLWRDLPVPNPQQIKLVHWTGQGFPQELADGGSGGTFRDDGLMVADFFSYPAYQMMRNAVAKDAAVAAYQFSRQVSISYNGRANVAEERPVSGNLLSTLQVRPQIGRLLSEADDSRSAPLATVLSYRLWTREFGADNSVIGRTLIINNKAHVIVGVLSPIFFGLAPGDNTELYTPMQQVAARGATDGRGGSLEDNRAWIVQVLARVNADARTSQVQAALATAFRLSWSRTPTDPSGAPGLRLYDGSRGLGFLRREFRNPLFVLGGLVSLLLVMACVNIANLLLARAIARRKEIAMRVTLGCSRARLTRQFLAESALLALLGGMVSVAFAYATANLVGQFVSRHGSASIDVAPDGRVLLIVAAFTMLTLMIFGILPAWKGARLVDPAWLKQGAASMGDGPTRSGRLGRALVVGQMAMSLILVAAAVIFSRNLLALQTADPGFDQRNLILFGTRPGTSGYQKERLLPFYLNAEQRLADTPGVAAVGLASMRPMNVGGWWETVSLIDQKERFNVSMNGVTPSYLPTYTGALIAGRNFTWSDVQSEAKLAIISEDLARKLGGRSVLGQTLTFTDGPPGAKRPTFEIVGIAPAVAATSVKERTFVVWVPFPKDASEATVLVRTSRPPETVLPAVREAFRAVDPNLPLVDVISMEEQIGRVLQRERMFATLAGGFGFLALALAVVGMYGVMAYNTSRRRNEIGVRLALGAMPRQVLAMILRDGLTLAVLGVLLGLPVIWIASEYVQKELTGLKAMEVPSILSALAVLLLAALFAVGVPAVRAASLQPSDTLRQE